MHAMHIARAWTGRDRIVKFEGQYHGHPSMFGIMFTDRVPSEYRDWATTHHELYEAIAVGMQLRGAMPEPDSREPWFICEAHAEGDTVDRVLDAFAWSLDAVLDARARGELHGADSA